jgi:hypothetical protein
VSVCLADCARADALLAFALCAPAASPFTGEAARTRLALASAGIRTADLLFLPAVSVGAHFVARLNVCHVQAS